MKNRLRSWQVTQAHIMTSDAQLPGMPLRENPQMFRWEQVAYPFNDNMERINELYWGLSPASNTDWPDRPGKPASDWIKALEKQLSSHATVICEREARQINGRDAEMLEAIGFDYRHLWCLPSGSYHLNDSKNSSPPNIGLRFSLNSESATIGVRFYRANASTIYWRANSLTVFGAVLPEAMLQSATLDIADLLGLDNFSMPVRRVFNTQEGNAIFTVSQSAPLTNPANQKERS